MAEHPEARQVVAGVIGCHHWAQGHGNPSGCEDCADGLTSAAEILSVLSAAGYEVVQVAEVEWSARNPRTGVAFPGRSETLARESVRYSGGAAVLERRVIGPWQPAPGTADTTKEPSDG